ncbi:MAG TPA: hypothetical protein VIL88_16575 [Devosia sp.]
MTSTEMIKQLGRSFWNSGTWEMQIVEEGGRDISTFTFTGTIIDRR